MSRNDKPSTPAPKVVELEELRKLAPDAGGFYEVPEGINVFSWSPEPPGTVNAKSTQVHLHFGQQPGAVFIVRFKGPRTLDALIAALVEHRRDVWGEP